MWVWGLPINVRLGASICATVGCFQTNVQFSGDSQCEGVMQQYEQCFSKCNRVCTMCVCGGGESRQRDGSPSKVVCEETYITSAEAVGNDEARELCQF